MTNKPPPRDIEKIKNDLIHNAPLENFKEAERCCGQCAEIANKHEIQVACQRWVERGFNAAYDTLQAELDAVKEELCNKTKLFTQAYDLLRDRDERIKKAEALLRELKESYCYGDSNEIIKIEDYFAEVE